MFNKSVFNRKDPLPHRSATVPESTASGLEAASGDRPLVRTVNPPKEPASQGSADLSRTASMPGKENTKEDKERMDKKIPEAVANRESGARLIVGPEVKLKGAQILDCDTLVVEGYVEATMDSRVIQIAEHGSFNGKVSVDVAEIHGSFDGELTARLQLIIHSTARVKGSIRYGKLVADEGCELRGNVDILSAERSSDKNDAPAAPVLTLGVNG